MLQYWRVLLLTFGLVAVGFIQLYGVFSNEGYQPRQPIPFSHVIHAGVLEMECLYCHHQAEKGAHAGIPSVELCMGCHSIVRQDSPDIQRLAEYYESGEPVPWVRIHALPEHSYFSHQWHVAAGVSCQECHGPIQNMPEVRQWQKLEMASCMECHRQDTHVRNVNHPPTYHEQPVTDEERAQFASLELTPTDTPGFDSVVRNFENYHAGEYEGADARVILARLKEYQEDLYTHGRGAQLRGANASVECQICHY